MKKLFLWMLALVALPGGALLAQDLTGTWQGALQLPNGKELRRLEGHRDQVWSVAFGGDGKRALSGGRDSNIRLWDVETGQPVCVIPGHTSVVTGRAPAFREAASSDVASCHVA